jgi:O-antigen ligase
MIVLIAAVLGIAGTYIQLVHGSFRFYRGASEHWNGRVYLAWGNIIAIGAAIALGMVVYSRQSNLLRLLALVTVGCGFFLVMASGARGATLGIIFAGLVVLLINPPRVSSGRIDLPKAQILGFLSLAVLLGYVSYLLATGQSTATISRLLNLLDQAADPMLRSRSNRFDYFAGAWRAWLDSPVIGQGLQGFRIFFCGLEAEGCYPHNAFLQVMADFGAVGLVLFVAMLWLGLRHARPSALGADPLRAIVFMAFVPVFFSAMVSGDITQNHRLFFFLGLLVMSSSPKERNDTLEEEA